ncbi:MAG: ABC transporter permease subunit [Eubacteriales bacterium]
MNIIGRELRSNLKSLIIWCVSEFLLIYVGMMKYDGLSKTGESVNELFQSLPEGMKAMFGVGELDLTTIGGFYSVFFLYFALLGSIHAAMLGATILSKEERDKTADFLLVKPICRSKVITSKIVAGMINLLAFNMTTLFTSILFVNIFGNGENIADIIVLMMAGLAILQVLFFSFGIGISALVRSAKVATSIASAVILGTFMLSIAVDMVEKLESLKYFTPFKYFQGKAIVLDNTLDPFYIILSCIMILFFTVITYFFYKKRDIHG